MVNIFETIEQAQLSIKLGEKKAISKDTWDQRYL